MGLKGRRIGSKSGEKPNRICFHVEPEDSKAEETTWEEEGHKARAEWRPLDTSKRSNYTATQVYIKCHNKRHHVVQ